VNPDVICKVCGHHGDGHWFADPIVCVKCPDRVCQDGPDGQSYRSQSANVDHGDEAARSAA